MAKTLNRVELLGRLGKDAELKYTPNGTALANMNLATNQSWKDKDGNWKEKTDWHRLVVWNKLAEVAGEYCKKGDQVFVAGRLETRVWEKDGQKHYMTEVVVQELILLGNKGHSKSEQPKETESNIPPDPPPAATDNELPF